jgi:hypothetical protein
MIGREEKENEKKKPVPCLSGRILEESEEKRVSFFL